MSDYQTYSNADNPVDVLILGGGFAGLTLALHLRLHLPEVSVAVVEPRPKPPRFTHKIGESSLGPQGSYLVQWLQLEDYLHKTHLDKFGARYFFKDAELTTSFAARPEIGSRRLPPDFPVYEYQVDRGLLEADLRDMLTARGVTWLPYRAEAVHLAQDTSAHSVQLIDPLNKAEQTVYARWVIDSTGRRQLLHRQHYPEQPATERNGRCSSVWFRVPGWIDVDDFVPASNISWHERVSSEHPRGIRFGRLNSTTHLCGTGYWVWLIALPDEVMSVGIVAQEALVPYETFGTAERAMQWLADNEPKLAETLKGREMMDFRGIRRYSHPVVDFISPQRWAQTGDALGFADPFYSPGGDMIALANLIVVESIRRERKGMLDAATCHHLTENMRRHQATATDAIQSIYPCLGASRISGAHIVWDFFSLVSPMVAVIRGFNDKLYDFLASEAGTQLLAEVAALRHEVDQLLVSWLKTEHAYLAPGSMLDHGVKLDELVSKIWLDPMGKDVAFLANHWLAGLKALAAQYHAQGPSWDFFDPIVYANEVINPHATPSVTHLQHMV